MCKCALNFIGLLVGCCQSSDFQQTKPQPHPRPPRFLAYVTKPLLCSNLWDPFNRFPSKKTLLFVVQVHSVITQRHSVKARSPSPQTQFPLQFRSGQHKSQPTEFRTLAPTIYSIINAISLFIESYHSTYNEQKAPDDSGVHRSLHNCGSAEWSLIRVTILTPRIWRRLVDCREIRGTLVKVSVS